jgi:hypothetical protein
MINQGVQSIADIRRRYDGIRRNPWDEAECGHHYARAMASWSSFVSLSGFRYDGPLQHVYAVPRWQTPQFQSFWSAGTGWGVFEISKNHVGVEVIDGTLGVASLEFTSSRIPPRLHANIGSESIASTAEPRGRNVFVKLSEARTIKPGQKLTVTL